MNRFFKAIGFRLPIRVAIFLCRNCTRLLGRPLLMCSLKGDMRLYKN